MSTRPSAVGESGKPVPAVFAELVPETDGPTPVSRALAGPCALLGRSDVCDVVLAYQSVAPVHCVLFPAADGVGFVDHECSGGTLVNGSRATSAVLHDGDLLSFGPFRFRVRTVQSPTPPDPESAASEPDLLREALNIQAAAIAAQHGALYEEEMRLAQRRDALDQHEAQLAAHLDDKRRRLAELRDHCQEARRLLAEERAEHEAARAEASRETAAGRAEIEAGRAQLRTERRRLAALRRRLRRRFHRRWAAEHDAVKAGQREVEAARAELGQRARDLDTLRAQLDQARLRLNAECEIARREVEDGRETLRRVQCDWHTRHVREEEAIRAAGAAVAERESHLARAKAEFARERQSFDTHRATLQPELAGLERRVEALRQHLPARAPGSTDSAGSEPMTVDRDTPPVVEWRVEALEDLTRSLADERARLVEQWERLVRSQEEWRQAHAVAAADLDSLARQLADRERGADEAERRCDARTLHLGQLRRQLEGRLSLLSAQTLAWEIDRKRQSGELEGRRHLVERQAALLGALRRRWYRRHRDDRARLQTDLEAWATLRLQVGDLLGRWRQRALDLVRLEQRAAERALALEQYRQECIVQSPDPARAERRLEHLRRHWEHELAAHAERIQDAGRELRSCGDRIDVRAAEVERQTADLARRAESLSRRERAAEHAAALARDTAARQRVDAERLRAACAATERHRDELAEEVERLVGILIDESRPARSVIGRAA